MLRVYHTQGLSRKLGCGRISGMATPETKYTGRWFCGSCGFGVHNTEKDAERCERDLELRLGEEKQADKKRAYEAGLRQQAKELWPYIKELMEGDMVDGHND